MKIFLHLLINTLAIFLVSQFLSEVYVANVTTAFIVALVLAVLNTFVKPLIQLLALPITIISLGLFSLLVNIAMIYLADYLVKGFSIESFVSVLLFGLLVSLISSAVSKAV